MSLALIVAAMLGTVDATAQDAPPPPGPYVVDLYGASIGVPQGAAFLPPVAADAPVPGRGSGFVVGAHVYGGRLGGARLGWGAMLVNVRATEKRPAPTSSTTTTSTLTTAPPGVQVDMRSLAPQISFNFGTRDGWSYLSAGVGLTEVIARAVDLIDVRRESGRVMTINAGAGARWFIARHVAVGFDARLHRLGAAGTMPASLQFAIGGGISLR